MPAGRVVFPPDVNPSDFNGKIIECSYNKEDESWHFMRDRPDKDRANHIKVGNVLEILC